MTIAAAWISARSGPWKLLHRDRGPPARGARSLAVPRSVGAGLGTVTSRADRAVAVVPA